MTLFSYVSLYTVFNTSDVCISNEVVVHHHHHHNMLVVCRLQIKTGHRAVEMSNTKQ